MTYFNWTHSCLDSHFGSCFVFLQLSCSVRELSTSPELPVPAAGQCAPPPTISDWQTLDSPKHQPSWVVQCFFILAGYLSQHFCPCSNIPCFYHITCIHLHQYLLTLWNTILNRPQGLTPLSLPRLARRAGLMSLIQSSNCPPSAT